MKKKNIIEFKILDMLDGIIEEPIPAKKAIPDWYKNLKKELSAVNVVEYEGGSIRPNQTMSIKACPPIQDYLCTGYILPNITDLCMTYIGKREDGPEYLGVPTLNFNYIDLHTPDQIEGSNIQNQDVYKIISPWLIKTPPGYSCLFLKPWYSDTRGINIIPAVVDTDVFHCVNFPFLFDSTGKNELVPVGTPLVHVIPFKREPWKKEMIQITDEEYTKGRKRASLMLKNFYRKLRQENKRDFI